MTSPEDEEDDGRIDWVSVSSTNVQAIAWWYAVREQNGILAVAFLEKGPAQPQRVYWYHRVPRYVFDGMLRANSKGKFCHYALKNKYHATEMTGRCPGPPR